MSEKAGIFLDKELGWLKFNERVLFQASRNDVPILERIHFSNIFNSNLDEFFMKRVSRLLRRIRREKEKFSHAAPDLDRELMELLKEVKRLNSLNATLIEEQLLKELRSKQIVLHDWKELGAADLKWVETFFRNQLFPILTPMAVDRGHPFPLISNLTFSLAVELRDGESKEKLFARIKAPDVFPNWINLPRVRKEPSFRYVSVLDIIQNHLHLVFPDMEVLHVMPFQITRGLDVEEHDGEDAEDLLELIAEEIKLRRFADVVRLEVPKGGSKWLVNFLKEELEISDDLVFELPTRIEHKRMIAVSKLQIAKLRYPRHRPKLPKAFESKEKSIFSILKVKDVLVHHPFESFEASVERFINEAADDPEVLSIKMTLYRAGEKSSIIEALKRANRKGKQVVCLIELKARLDEARNIQWARMLEDEGIHVVYGMLRLKTHAKVTLVVRRERKELRTYAHIGTGNYNPQTAQFYTDLSMFTAEPALCLELTEVFHYLTGRSRKKDYQLVLLSPVNMRQRFLELVQREVANAQLGLPARIVAKFNNFDDSEVIEALYRAAKAGVKLDFIVRGFSALAPMVFEGGGSITLRSVIGRFLEHSRVFYFQDGKSEMKDGVFYMGSADWMRRNLSERVEVAVPVRSAEGRAHLARYFELMLSDKVQHWSMNAKGVYNHSGLDLPHPHDLLIQEFSAR